MPRRILGSAQVEPRDFGSPLTLCTVSGCRSLEAGIYVAMLEEERYWNAHGYGAQRPPIMQAIVSQAVAKRV